MIFNETACKLEIVQNNAKLFFQFVIELILFFICIRFEYV